MFGNGVSTSPSNAGEVQGAERFPPVTLHDNVACQKRLLDHLGVREIALVAGWSMAGCQAYEWAVQHPEMVRAILPFCASARCSPHNFVFLEGVKAALLADAEFAGGRYLRPPERGLRAFGRVYAGWAYSQTFWRERLHARLGFPDIESFLLDWEADHLRWDANDLLAKLASWQKADVSDNSRWRGDLPAALRSIRARTIVMPCDQDLYFPPADNAIEVQHIDRAELRVVSSPWGHCAPSPGNDPVFTAALEAAAAELLGG